VNDTKGTTRFEVAGRLFWEAHVFAPSYTSYTTNGFFDKLGYKEPQLPSETTEFLLKLLIPIAVVLILIGVLCYIRHRDHARAEEDKMEAIKRREQRKESQRRLADSQAEFDR
jgi:ATP-dependent Zn protease